MCVSSSNLICFVDYIYMVCILHAVIMFLISWAFTIVSLALASLIYYYVSIKGKAGDWGDGFKSAYFQLALRSLRSLGGACTFENYIIYIINGDFIGILLYFSDFEL